MGCHLHPPFAFQRRGDGGQGDRVRGCEQERQVGFRREGNSGRGGERRAGHRADGPRWALRTRHHARSREGPVLRLHRQALGVEADQRMVSEAGEVRAGGGSSIRPEKGKREAKLRLRPRLGRSRHGARIEDGETLQGVRGRGEQTFPLCGLRAMHGRRGDGWARRGVRRFPSSGGGAQVAPLLRGRKPRPEGLHRADLSQGGT